MTGEVLDECADLRNRGVRGVFFLVCDGLKGLPEVVGNVCPQTILQTCLVHLIRAILDRVDEADRMIARLDQQIEAQVAPFRDVIDLLDGTRASACGSLR